MNHLVSIVKSNGAVELFEEEKLVGSLERAGASSEAVEEVVDQVEHEMRDGMPTSEIYSHAFALLRKHSPHTAVKYSTRRALMELGPDGFPFEKLVARIFKARGYETLTDQTLLGVCVEHEVDVVAWKGPDLAMVEAKFHNETGLRSDLKVALYVKARFDDLSATEFEHGGVRRKLSERWLVTNTKFTDHAIKYGECNGLKMLGWNYPTKDNLHQVIEQYGLLPITCLSTLTRQEKNDLIAKGVLVCSDIAASATALAGAGVKPEMIPRVLAEAAAADGKAR